MTGRGSYRRAEQEEFDLVNATYTLAAPRRRRRGTRARTALLGDLTEQSVDVVTVVANLAQERTK